MELINFIKHNSITIQNIKSQVLYDYSKKGEFLAQLVKGSTFCALSLQLLEHPQTLVSGSSCSSA